MIKPIMINLDDQVPNEFIPSELVLNKSQKRASKAISRYILGVHEIDSKDDEATINKLETPLPRPDWYNFLLLGPGGSGKTTVITNVFNKSNKKIAFCAFTNKATQVLKQISKKFKVDFRADFMTIHKMLALDIKFLNTEYEIAFTFDKTKITHMAGYDIIIIDECSTISKELFSYLRQAWEYILFTTGHKIKYIFLGDYWQLPPVGENVSTIFHHSRVEGWEVSKLSKVMRSGNEQIQNINTRLLQWMEVFREKRQELIDKFILKYPFNLTKKDKDLYTSDLDVYLNKYLNLWKTEHDTVMITYSRTNCNKTNFAIQDRIDLRNNRELPEHRDCIKFYEGDRCCIDKPIELYQTKNTNGMVILEESLGVTLYNGEIFDILKAEDVKIITHLNQYKGIDSYFEGQLLIIRRINEPDDGALFEVLHIDDRIVNKARKILYRSFRKEFYLNVMSSFIKKYPKLTYGYCITIYKSQGSEWRNVLINLNSIKWSIVGSSNKATLEKKRQLFKTTYTALSRASHSMLLFWSA